MGLFRVWEQPPKTMALKLIANYSKRLGLPGYSSHQFSVSVETEITNINELENESSRLYLTLQKSVDAEIQSTGFVPEEGYGNGTPALKSNGTNGHSTSGAWKCSDKQRDLILKLIDEHHLEKGAVQNLAKDLFGTSEVSSLNKLQASGLIDHLIEQYGGTSNRRGTTPAGRFNGKSSR
jgi:hypothetical protein